MSDTDPGAAHEPASAAIPDCLSVRDMHEMLTTLRGYVGERGSVYLYIHSSAFGVRSVPQISLGITLDERKAYVDPNNRGSFLGATFDEVVGKAKEWIAETNSKRNEVLIRRMSVAIMEITGDGEQADRAKLLARGFTAEEIDDTINSALSCAREMVRKAESRIGWSVTPFLEPVAPVALVTPLGDDEVPF